MVGRLIYLPNNQWRHALCDDIGHLSLALHASLDQQHTPAVHVPSIAHHDARRDDHVDHTPLVIQGQEVEAFGGRGRLVDDTMPGDLDALSIVTGLQRHTGLCALLIEPSRIERHDVIACRESEHRNFGRMRLRPR
jgi:hypothetical protein